MSSRKARYYPKQFLTESQTRFGAIETNLPELYETPISGKTIVRVDTLYALTHEFGNGIIVPRDSLYKLVSGSAEDDEYRKILTTFYMQFTSFTNFVDTQYYFGGSDLPLICRIVNPMRKTIDEYTEAKILEMQNKGCSLLQRTNDYLYFVCNYVLDVTTIEGGKLIC